MLGVKSPNCQQTINIKRTRAPTVEPEKIRESSDKKSFAILESSPEFNYCQQWAQDAKKQINFYVRVMSGQKI